ncbi:MAG: SMC-Scp complex subunit ScpB [Oscillospiraceae bacterium]|nr:SMC-Scp complex subunit ScpB [Oscillospiraceae bacterium]
MDNQEMKRAAEAILFAAGDSVDLQRLTEALELTPKKTENLMEELKEEFNSQNHGFKIMRYDDSYQFVTHKEYQQQIRTVMDLNRKKPLSQAAMEVLSVIAYNQPVTKAFVEQIRGVDCSGVIGSLTVKELVEEKGRLELPGRPLLYGTTENFLRCFNISSIDELPKIPEKEQKEVSEETTEIQEVKDSTEETITATPEEIVAMATEE